MYSESDLDEAVAAGVLRADDVSAFRDHVASLRAAPAVDEEQFRLLSGFNDIFVTIATLILLIAVGWIGARIGPAIGAIAVAATGWGLAEYFTRIRRMALPSIILLGAFVGGLFFTVMNALNGSGAFDDAGQSTEAIIFATAAAIAAAGTWLHWRRFQVPITIAAGAAAIVGLILSLIAAAIGDAPWTKTVMLWGILIAGIAVFAFAMRWDSSDPERRTRRSDVGFWLHLLAAPMIVHPIFSLLGVLDGRTGAGAAVTVIAVYILLGIAALAVDRRALLVSALFYVLWAIERLISGTGAVELSFALTALVIGSALLLLSAFWQTARALVVRRLSEDLARRLPPTTGDAINPRPA